MVSELRRQNYTVADGYEISVAELGEGPVVVFLHGSGPGASAASNFRQNAQVFADAGFRVILPDLIGYGASSKPDGIDYPLELFTTTLLDALKQHGVTGGHLIGNSLGGGIAIQIALDHPEFATGKLVLMAPGCLHEQADYFKMPGIASMRGSFGSDDFDENEQRRLITNLVYDPVHATDELVKERFAVAKTQSKDAIMRMKTPALGPRLGELKIPIQLFWGYDERFMPLEGIDLFFKACEDVRCVTFNKTGHWVQVERAEEFNRYTLDFLRG